jgi:hypothetical protein
MDRAEKIGTGAALLFHVALIGAMSMSLAQVNATPEPPAMEVEFVEEVGLTAAAPQPIVIPPPRSRHSAAPGAKASTLARRQADTAKAGSAAQARAPRLAHRR